MENNFLGWELQMGRTEHPEVLPGSKREAWP